MPLNIDIDDMGLEIPEYNTAVKYFAHPQAKNIIASTLGLASLIIASTPAIKIAYSAMTKAKIVVIPNAYHDAQFGDASKPKPPKKPVQMAWRGGPGMDRQARRGAAWQGGAWQDRRGMARYGKARRCPAGISLSFIWLHLRPGG